MSQLTMARVKKTSDNFRRNRIFEWAVVLGMAASSNAAPLLVKALDAITAVATCAAIDRIAKPSGSAAMTRWVISAIRTALAVRSRSAVKLRSRSLRGRRLARGESSALELPMN